MTGPGGCEVSIGTTAAMHDVAIVGYGPTGLALAYWLGSAGHDVVVIERWPGIYPLPRAGHVDGEVMRLFQKMGAAEVIAADSSVSDSTVLVDSDGERLAEVPAEESHQGWEAHYSLFQPNMERTLGERVAATGRVTVLRGWSVSGVSTEADRVAIDVVAGENTEGAWTPTGERRSLCARWLIGADGANSMVAPLLPAPVEDLGYRSRALVIFAERIDPSVGVDMPRAEVGMIPSRPYIAWRQSGNRFARWEFLVLEHESTEVMNEEATTWELIRPWGFGPQNCRLVRHSVFEFRTLIKGDWRQGRLLLAGDAAHLMPPFQGQGMCSGQRDAAALCWRLDLVLRGVCEEALLDSYSPERHAHVRTLIVGSAERGQVFNLTDPDEARARDVQMRKNFASGGGSENLKKSYGSVPPLTAGLLFRRDGAVVEPAGWLSAQHRVRHGHVESLLDDHVGARWLLVLRDSALVAGVGVRGLALLDRLGGRVWAIDAGEHGAHGGFQDVAGAYAGWLADLGCAAVLVRPDSYIFGGANDEEGVAELFDSLVTQLHLTAPLPA